MAKFDPNAADWDNPGEKTVWPEGKHLVVVASAKTKTSGGGKPMVEIRFESIDPESPFYKQEMPDWQFYLVDGSAQQKWYAQLCRSIDPKMEVHDPEDQSDLNRLLYNKPLVVRVEHEENEWQGKKRIRLRVRAHRGFKPEEEKLLRAAHGGDLVPNADDYNKDEDDVPF